MDVVRVAADPGDVLALGGAWLDRWGNVCTALTLLVIGALVLAGVI